MKRNLAAVAASAILPLVVAAAPAVADAGPSPADGAVVATFATRGAHVWRATLTDSRAVASARAQLAGTEKIPTFPHGLIVYGSADENVGYTWHLVNVRMVQTSMELCDGRPSDVEARRLTSRHYCPWAAKVVALRDL